MGRRRTTLVTTAIALAIVAGFVWSLRGRDPGPSASPAADTADAGAASTVTRDDPSAPGVPPEDGGAPAGTDPGEAFDDEHNAWAAVDLEAVRRAMPDNVYWRMSAPTRDPEVLREREEERARWNEAWGKVLSNTASEQEIVDYYTHRDRLASDYVQFATYLLENHGEQLSIRDLGLLKVAVELNLARLEEIPRQMAEAQERRKAHEQAREQWRRDQEDFADAQPAR